MKTYYNNITHYIPESLRLPFVIFLSAFLIHLIHIGFAGWGQDLLSPYAFSDEYLYLHRAWHMAFIDSSGGYMGEILSITPYSRLLTWAYQLFGDGFWVPLFVNAILMSLAVTFTALITRELFDERTAWIAGGLGVLCGPFVFFAGLTYKTNLVLFFLASGLYYSVRYLNTKSLRYLFLATIFIFSSSVERYQLIFVLCILLYFVFLPLWKNSNVREMLQPAIIVITACMVVVGLIVSIGNNNTSNAVSPIGINIYVGYAPGAWGGYTPVKSVGDNILSHRLNTKVIAEKESAEKLSNIGVQWHWIRKVISYYSSVPQDLIILQSRKFGLLFAQATEGQPEEHRVWRWQRPALMVAFIDLGMIIALALFAFYYLRKNKQNTPVLFLFYSIALYAFGVWIFFIQERYRMPIMLMLIPFAAYSVNKIISEKNNSKRIKNVGAVLLLYAFTLILNQLNQVGSGWSEDHSKTRAMHERRSETEFKIYRLKDEALTLNTESAWLDLSIWFNRRHFYDDAIGYAKRAIIVAPDSFKGYELLLDVYTQTKNFTALTDLKKKLEAREYLANNQRLNTVMLRIQNILHSENERLKNIHFQDREKIRDIIRRR